MSNPKRVLLVMCAAGTLVVLENQILTVALPAMAADLGASNSQLSWIVDAYVLTLAALVLPMGALQDRYGHRRFFEGGLILFAAASLSAAVAQTSGQVIAGRAVMGVGAAALYPATLAILVRTFTAEKERQKAIALWAATTGIGVVLGPILGGVLVQILAWPAVFVVNVAISLVVLVGSRMWLTESADLSETPLDGWGMILSSVALLSAVYALIEGPTLGWTAPSEILAAVLALGCAVGFVVVEQRTPHPLLPLGLFRNPQFSSGCEAQFFLFFLASGTALIGTLYIQVVQRHTPITAGLMLMPFAVTVAVTAALSPRLTRKYPRGGLILGMGQLAATMMLAVGMSPGQGDLPVLVLLASLGIAYGLVSPQATDRIMVAVPLGIAGVGGAVNNAVRQIAASVGIAVSGSVLSVVYATTISTKVAGLPLTVSDQERIVQSSVAPTDQILEPLRTAVRAAVSAALLDAVHAAFVALTVVAVIGVVVLVVATRRAAPTRSG